MARVSKFSSMPAILVIPRITRLRSKLWRPQLRRLQSLNGNGAIHGGSVPNGHVNGTIGVKEKLANGSVDVLTNGFNEYTSGSRA